MCGRSQQTESAPKDRESAPPWGAPSCRQSFGPPSCSNGPLCTALWGGSTWRPGWRRSLAALWSGCEGTAPKLCSRSLGRYVLKRKETLMKNHRQLFTLLHNDKELLSRLLLFLNNDNKVSLLSRHTLFFSVYRYSVWVLHGNRFMMHFNDVWREEVSQRFPNLYQPVCLILSNFPWTDRLGVVLIYYISFCLFFKKNNKIK